MQSRDLCEALGAPPAREAVVAKFPAADTARKIGELYKAAIAAGGICFSVAGMLRRLLIGLSVALAGCGGASWTADDPRRLHGGVHGTGFYTSKPAKGDKPDTNLRGQTQVILVKAEGPYSLVKLQDRSVGYVASNSLYVSTPQAAVKPRADPGEEKAGRGARGQADSKDPPPRTKQNRSRRRPERLRSRRQSRRRLPRPTPLPQFRY